KKDDGTPAKREVRLEFLRPKELEEAQAACPTIFQPLGTIEWHGVHNVVGVDSLKAHALCVRADRVGGGIAPAVLPHHRAYGSVPRRFM
ncbi:MAG: creatininase family protein, partial [Thermoanaerobaculales bacterium]|nr:creatininase family protein [Thermoanaerobaculales bacterium]